MTITVNSVWDWVVIYFAIRSVGEWYRYYSTSECVTYAMAWLFCYWLLPVQAQAKAQACSKGPSPVYVDLR